MPADSQWPPPVELGNLVLNCCPLLFPKPNNTYSRTPWGCSSLAAESADVQTGWLV